VPDRWDKARRVRRQVERVSRQVVKAFVHGSCTIPAGS
jgi:hypothetical protein